MDQENKIQDNTNDQPQDDLGNPIDPQDMNLENFSENDEDPGTSWAKKLGLLVFEVVKVVVISLAIILPIRLFLVQPFYVEGASMEPNFYQNEYLIIDEISYRFNEPQRGEVIIFKSPHDDRSYFIKRIIGLPAEEIEVIDGSVYIDGNKLEENYISNFSNEDHEPVVLGSNEYFVMGDNRINSMDSRQFGPVEKNRVIGKVWIRGWPINRLNTFNLPEYK